MGNKAYQKHSPVTVFHSLIYADNQYYKALYPQGIQAYQHRYNNLKINILQ